jgi:hypothetical protein
MCSSLVPAVPCTTSVLVPLIAADRFPPWVGDYSTARR